MWRKGRPVLFSGSEVFNRCNWMHQHDRSSKPKRHHSSNVNTISIFDQCERMAASAPNTESRTSWQYFWTCSHTNSEGTRAPQALSNHLTASVLSALCSTIQARLSSGIFSGMEPKLSKAQQRTTDVFPSLYSRLARVSYQLWAIIKSSNNTCFGCTCPANVSAAPACKWRA